MSVRLFIGNLPYAATEADLREHLSGVGAPTQIVLPTDRETGRPRGPIKERPVGRLYDADEDWRAQDDDLDMDNFATSRKDDDTDDEE